MILLEKENAKISSWPNFQFLSKNARDLNFSRQPKFTTYFRFFDSTSIADVEPLILPRPHFNNAKRMVS